MAKKSNKKQRDYDIYIHSNKYIDVGQTSGFNEDRLEWLGQAKQI